MINRCVIILAFFIVTNAWAQSVLKDPTRPANKIVVVNENTDEGGLNADGELLPGGESQASFPKVKLSAIVVTEDAKYAIINNEVVYEGQQWHNVLLAKIQPYSITLSLNDKNKEITINNNDFIKEADENY